MPKVDRRRAKPNEPRDPTWAMMEEMFKLTERGVTRVMPCMHCKGTVTYYRLKDTGNMRAKCSQCPWGLVQ